MKTYQRRYIEERKNTLPFGYLLVWGDARGHFRGLDIFSTTIATCGPELKAGLTQSSST